LEFRVFTTAKPFTARSCEFCIVAQIGALAFSFFSAQLGGDFCPDPRF
jgi:hypothetical protein